MNRFLQRILKPLLVISIFVSLSIVFYFALLDALYRSDSLPDEAYSPLKPTLSKSDILFDKSAKWAALSIEEKREHLLENPVYATYNITKPVQKERVNVLLIISSGPRRRDRRDALRKTWLKECVTTAGVRLILSFCKSEAFS